MTPVRLAPLPPAQWDDAAKAALSAAMPPGDAELFLSGAADAPRMPNALTTMVRHPELAQQFLAFNSTLLRAGRLAPRLRELLVLRVAWRTRSEYEWVQHARLALRHDISPADIAAIADGTGDWTELEAALITATDELLDGHVVTDATWQRLAVVLSEAELIEVVFVVGTYTCLAMVFNSLGIELDPELDPSIAPAIADAQ